MEENADGTLTVRFTAGGIDEMCWHLVTWGESVTIEQPHPPAPTSRRDVRGRSSDASQSAT